MAKVRVIARLDVKGAYVIKGIHLEGLRKIGDPVLLAKKYYEEGADEILFMDAVASLYERNNLFHIIEKACEQVFVPITIGGGIRTLADIHQALQSGADKIALNTAAVKNPALIIDAARTYGSQCIIGSIEAKQKGKSWEAYIDTGREETGLDVVDWARKLQDLGCGEIMITSVDQDGTKKGFDVDLIHAVNDAISLPLIACSGAGKLNHFSTLAKSTSVGAIAAASIFHYNLASVKEVKFELNSMGVETR